MIQQIEFVSYHFGYKEEYVLDKTPEWIERKYRQAAKDKSDQHRQNVIEQFKGFSLFLDAVLNKGKAFNEILPDPFAELEQETEKNTDFIEGQWWEKTT